MGKQWAQMAHNVLHGYAVPRRLIANDQFNTCTGAVLNEHFNLYTLVLLSLANERVSWFVLLVAVARSSE